MYAIPGDSFIEIDKPILIFIQKWKKTRIDKKSWKRNIKDSNSQLQNLLQSHRSMLVVLDTQIHWAELRIQK
jgi:hypothetical protein